MQQFQKSFKSLSQFYHKLDNGEAIKLGAKTGEDQMGKFHNTNCEQEENDKWSYPLSGEK